MRLSTAAGDAVPDTEIDALRGQLRGDLITPEHAEYTAVKAIWNKYHEREPGAIAMCTGAADVITSVRFAVEHDLNLTMKGGGHCFAGTSSVEGGLVIDLTRLKGIRVDPANNTVVAQPGLLQGDFDAETQHFGLAVTGSQESYIGIAGLTLGGGLGWLARHRGLLVDNLLSADIVLANGELRRASPQDDADLFWAIRGGGSNFGVATSFEYKLHPQGPCVAGLLAFPVDETVEVTARLHEYNATAPDALTTSFAFLTTPEGDRAVGIGFVHADPATCPDDLVSTLQTLGSRPLMNIVDTMPYLAVQQMLDHNTVKGRRYYTRSFHLNELREEPLAILAEGYATAPSPLTLVGGGLMGGVMARLPQETTPFPYREGYLVSILSQWENADEDEENAAWTRDVYDRIVRYTSGGVYVNHLGDDGQERVRASYGVNYDRLVSLKAKFDPDNLFRNNHNIRPNG